MTSPGLAVRIRWLSYVGEAFFAVGLGSILASKEPGKAVIGALQLVLVLGGLTLFFPYFVTRMATVATAGRVAVAGQTLVRLAGQLALVGFSLAAGADMESVPLGAATLIAGMVITVACLRREQPHG